MPEFDPKQAGRAGRFLSDSYGTGALATDTQNLTNMLMASPAFQATLAQIASASGGLRERIAANLGARGLNTTGIGALSNALGQSAGAFQTTGARGQLSSMAAQLAAENLMARMQAAPQYAQAFQRNTFGDYLKAFGGGALSAFGANPTGIIDAFKSILGGDQPQIPQSPAAGAASGGVVSPRTRTP